MDSIIEIKNLKKYFTTPHGQLHAVDRVSLSFERGKTIGVVGESGCGKSTLGRTIIHLLESTGGQIFYEGRDVTKVNARQLRELREHMQIIFQDPYSSLDPRKNVESAISEPLIVSGRFRKSQIMDKTAQLMETVGIDERLRHSYPHELDGGRRQRVGIARALALNPSFVVCDEPVSALDVSIQAQVLNLLKKLQQTQNITYMFVTHDLSVVRHISDTICVMYLGQVVEYSPAREIFTNPLHPYTKALLSAIPSTDIDKPMKREILRGEITSPINPKPGCRFAARCKYRCDKCAGELDFREVSPGHYVSCCRVEELKCAKSH